MVAQFFNHIRKTTDIVNPDLYDAISYNRLRENSYMQQMMSYIDKCEMLAGIVEQEPMTSSSDIPDYMGALIGITSVTSAVKYGINQL